MIERTMLVIRPPVMALPPALQAATARLRPATLGTHPSIPGVTLPTVTTTTAKVTIFINIDLPITTSRTVGECIFAKCIASDSVKIHIGGDI